MSNPASLGQLLVAVNLSRCYKGLQAVANFDAVVHAGEIVVLLGPNGCGKTTSIEMCLGLRRSDSGSVTICGVDPSANPRLLAGIVGVQLQGAQIHPRAKLREYFDYIGALHRDTQAAFAMVDLLGLGPSLGTMFCRLSGGQQRRTLVAAALCGRPQLGVLDEPTSGVDPESRSQFWHAVRSQVADTGLGILTTTHDLSEADRYADRILIMRDGKIAQSGTRDALLRSLPFKEVCSLRSGTASPAEVGEVGLVLQRFGAEYTIGLGADFELRLDRLLKSASVEITARRSASLEDAYMFGALPVEERQ